MFHNIERFFPLIIVIHKTVLCFCFVKRKETTDELKLTNSKKERTLGLFEFIGAIFRFPIFLLIVCLKLFIQFPIESMFKVFGVAMGILGFITSILFSDRDGLKESKDTIKELFELLLDFECFDFSGTINFLKYGSFE